MYGAFGRRKTRIMDWAWRREKDQLTNEEKQHYLETVHGGLAAWISVLVRGVIDSFVFRYLWLAFLASMGWRKETFRSPRSFETPDTHDHTREVDHMNCRHQDIVDESLLTSLVVANTPSRYFFLFGPRELTSLPPLPRSSTGPGPVVVATELHRNVSTYHLA